VHLFILELCLRSLIFPLYSTFLRKSASIRFIFLNMLSHIVELRKRGSLNSTYIPFVLASDSLTGFIMAWGMNF